MAKKKKDRRGDDEEAAYPEPPEPCSSIYGARDSSPDELEQIVSSRLGRSFFGVRDSPVSPPSNDGAHDVWIPLFLDALSCSPNWRMAARVAGVDHRTPAKRAEVDPEFAEQAKQAEENALDLIESAAFKSAVYGDIEPVFQSGVKVGEKVKYSDRMRELLLKAGRPEKYRERLSIDTTMRNKSPALTPEERKNLVLDLLPSLGDYARFMKAKPVIDV